jgi:tetratricopeptide (TPR) repeat protein
MRLRGNIVQAQELIRRLDVAWDKRKSGDYSEALVDFESLEALSENPQDIAALRLFQAMCLTDMGRVVEAGVRISNVDKERLGKTYRIDYESECARIERAEGQIQEALDRVVALLKVIDASADKQRMLAAASGLEILRGILLAESGRCDEAVPVLREVSLQDDWWVEARLHLGDCHYKKQLYKDAIDCYLGIISGEKKVHPIHRDAALRNIGFAYYDLKQYAKAVEYLTQVEHAYDETPDMKAELFSILASAYSRLGMTQESAKYAGFSKGTNSVQ